MSGVRDGWWITADFSPFNLGPADLYTLELLRRLLPVD